MQGLNGYIVVDTKDVLLICEKGKEQAIKEYVLHVKNTTGEKFLRTPAVQKMNGYTEAASNNTLPGKNKTEQAEELLSM